ncbi:MAG: hypothetical protein NPIRA02_20070 [Nitrospirales bacterium]|nr:MAG: hypothetical protein NPIRA02_20070 [Nitrospirales bacterium]
MHGLRNTKNKRNIFMKTSMGSDPLLTPMHTPGVVPHLCLRCWDPTIGTGKHDAILHYAKR